MDNEITLTCGRSVRLKVKRLRKMWTRKLLANHNLQPRLLSVQLPTHHRHGFSVVAKASYRLVCLLLLLVGLICCSMLFRKPTSTVLPMFSGSSLIPSVMVGRSMLAASNVVLVDDADLRDPGLRDVVGDRPRWPSMYGCDALCAPPVAWTGLLGLCAGSGFFTAIGLMSR